MKTTNLKHGYIQMYIRHFQPTTCPKNSNTPTIGNILLTLQTTKNHLILQNSIKEKKKKTESKWKHVLRFIDNIRSTNWKVKTKAIITQYPRNGFPQSPSQEANFHKMHIHTSVRACKCVAIITSIYCSEKRRRRELTF